MANVSVNLRRETFFSMDPSSPFCVGADFLVTPVGSSPTTSPRGVRSTAFQQRSLSCDRISLSRPSLARSRRSARERSSDVAAPTRAADPRDATQVAPASTPGGGDPQRVRHLLGGGLRANRPRRLHRPRRRRRDAAAATPARRRPRRPPAAAAAATATPAAAAAARRDGRSDDEPRRREKKGGKKRRRAGGRSGELRRGHLLGRREEDRSRP